MSLFRWRSGRQDAKYDVFDLARVRLPVVGGGFDCCVIRYEGPVDLPKHRDPVDGNRHFRLNIVFGSKGEFAAKTIVNWRGRVILFRPDEQEHEMRLVEGRRYVLSVGVAIKSKKPLDTSPKSH